AVVDLNSARNQADPVRTRAAGDFLEAVGIAIHKDRLVPALLDRLRAPVRLDLLGTEHIESLAVSPLDGDAFAIRIEVPDRVLVRDAEVGDAVGRRSGHL